MKNIAFTLLMLIFTSPSFGDEPKLSETAKQKCNNTHGKPIRYECSFENGILSSILRFDKDKNQNFYLSKSVTLLPGEKLEKVTEYNPQGETIRIVDFDKNGLKISDNQFDLKKNTRFLEKFENHTHPTTGTTEHNLSFRAKFAGDRFVEGFRLSGKYDSTRGRHFIDQFIQYGPDKKIIFSKNNSASFNCRQNSNGRVELMVIEPVGIDIHHPNYREKIATNPGDPIDGIDNDGNGLIDDCAGFSLFEQSSNFNIIKPFFLDGSTMLNATHGTSVSDIAMRNNDLASLYPVSGSLRDPNLYKNVKKIIADRKVSVVNMSFMYEVKYSGKMNPADDYRDAKIEFNKLMDEANATLFVVGAGNGPYSIPSPNGINVDRWKHYPVSYQHDHLIAVGAIVASEITVKALHQYQKAQYSNYGLLNVDILAPGTGVDMALPGGHTTETTVGTSFASPFVANLVSQAIATLPDLEKLKIKELLLKTAYIPNLRKVLNVTFDHPEIRHRKRKKREEYLKANPDVLPVRSGGIVHPQRFLKAVQLVKEQGLDINDAVFRSRKVQTLNGRGEESSSEYFEMLKQFWSQRSI